MINTNDQEELFRLIANYIKKDIKCIAIGGTAMMFAGYKNTTKDIDLVFESTNDRDIFISAIEELGYSKKTLSNIYDEKRIKNPNKPLIYSRGDERFDLFVESVFGFKLDIKNIIQRHDFIGKHELIIHVLSKEFLILLKSITNREKDFEDIETIIKTEKNIDWNQIIDLAVEQKENNEWILIDLEESMKEIKKFSFIPSKFFEKLYKN